jgi:hypothetical protein
MFEKRNYGLWLENDAKHNYNMPKKNTMLSFAFNWGIIIRYI